MWLNWDFYVKVWIAESTSCWPMQWGFPTSFPSFQLLRKPWFLGRLTASPSHWPRRKHDSRKPGERSLREIYTQIAFWNFIYPWAGEMNFMDELRGDVLIYNTPTTVAEKGLRTSDLRLPPSEFPLETSDFRLPTLDLSLRTLDFR